MTARKYIAWLIAIVASVALSAGGAAAQDSPRLRIIHLARDLPAVDIRINGELAIADLAYEETSAYIRLPAANLDLQAVIAGTDAQAFQRSLELERPASAIVLSPGAQLSVFPDDLGPLEFGTARLLIINALDADTRVVIVPPDERIAGDAVAPGSSLGPVDLPADHVELRLLPADANDHALIFDFSARLAAGVSSMLILHGDAKEPQLKHTAAAADGSDKSGRVRFVHTAQRAAPVDLRIDDRLILPSLAFANPSEHISIPSGTRELTLSLGNTVLSSTALEIREGQMQTVAIMGTPAWLKIAAYPDSTRGLNESSAIVSLVNAVPNSIIRRLRLDSGAIVAADVAFGEDSGAAQIAPGWHSLSLSLEIGDDRGTIETPPTRFYAGAYYNLIALAGSAFSAPRLLIAETSLMRRVNAPPPTIAAPALDDQGELAAESDYASDPSAPTEAPEPAPIPDSAAKPEAERETPVDSQTDARAANAVDANETVNPALIAVGPYAMVALAPSGRLQLRQYPSSHALSLGLIPGESTLTVLGRRGLTKFYPGDVLELPLDLSDFAVDPAAGLYPAQDLPPAETWLFVMYQTEDGGALVGWVNAYYLQVFDARGQLQRLASLPTVRQNRAGSAVNTAIEPPKLADSVTVLVHRLSPGALLNLRVANDPNSEVLAFLEPDTELRLLGLDRAEAWVYVDYAGEPGKIIRGWVSADYAQLLLHGRPASVSALRALDETVAPEISDSARGDIRSLEAESPTPVPPPDDILSGISGEVALDPGAMLHLRRQPDAHAESLALIPARSIVSIKGITENAEWLLSRYEDKDGWIFARYVSLLLRGRRYNREYVESMLPAHDNRGNPRE